MTGLSPSEAALEGMSSAGNAYFGILPGEGTAKWAAYARLLHERPPEGDTAREDEAPPAS